MLMNNKDSYWRKPSGLQDLRTFPNDIIKITGVINITVKCNYWLAKDVMKTVVEDGRRPIIASDLFPQLGLSVIQSRDNNND